MTEFDSTSLSLAEPEAPEVSTQLDTGKPTEPGIQHKEPAEPDEPKKPESRMDAIKRAAEDIEKGGKKEEPEAEKQPEKAEKAEKVEPEGDPKPAAEKPETEAQRRVPLSALSEEDRKAALDRMTPDQRRKYELNQTPAPDILIPAAKEKWANVPGEVKGEIARIMKEHDSEVSAAREFIQPLIKYHQMAQQTGTTVHEALERYVNMEQQLRHDPAQGFRALLQNMQMEPTEAIGQILRAFNVNPQALAQHMAQNPQAYFTQAPKQAQQQPEDPRIAQLEQRLAQTQADHVRATVIEPFKASHPRYAELEHHIASFLKSDMIPSSLGLYERLEVAYDMAARISPASSYKAPEPTQDLAPSERAVASDLGGKSVRGAPSSGVDTSRRGTRKMSRGEAIEAAMAELGIS